MTREDERPRPAGRGGPRETAEAARRRERLAAALKDNLRRRKAQARARAGRSGGPREKDGDG